MIDVELTLSISQSSLVEPASRELTVTSLRDSTIPLSQRFLAHTLPVAYYSTERSISVTCSFECPPAIITAMATAEAFGELGLSIIGLGAQYPPYSLKPEEVEKLGTKYYPESAA